MIRKSVMILIIVALMVGVMPSKLIGTVLATTDNVSHLAEVPSGYTGIYTAEDLNQVRNNLSGSYILMNDIDLTAATAEGGIYFNNGTGWTPIGNKTAPFLGSFNGNGYKITGLKQSIQSEQEIYAGLFGYAKNATITNLGMENNRVAAENTSLDSTTSNVYAGGIVGYGYHVTIANSYQSGHVSAESMFNGTAGGIIGYIDSSYNTFSTISNSYNTGTVYGKTEAGGIAGETLRTTISDVYNKGNFTDKASSYSGGIVGYLRSDSSITNANNTGNIGFRKYGGGIAGYASASSIRTSYNLGELSSTVSSSMGGGIVGYASSSTIKNSYNHGKISSSADFSRGGGIAGYLGSNSSVADSYNTAGISVDSSAGGIVGEMYSAVISRSFNTGTMSGSYAGGTNGWSSSGTIIDSFNIGIIKGKFDSGGIVGHSTNTTIKNTYNVGLVSNTISYSGSAKGGIAGEFDGSMENSYFLDNIQNGVGDGAMEGTYKKSYEQMKDQSTFAGFTFSTTWKIDKDSSFQFPTLSAVPSAETEKMLDLSMSSLPEKVNYVQGEGLNLTGAKITARTNHGNQTTIPISEEMISGYDANKTGYQSIKVSYNGLSTSFTVNVKATYTVTFKDYDGRILKTETVVDGESATAPEAPIREGYTFSGWSSTFTNVKSNLTITAQYMIHSYQVTYMDGDNVLSSEGYQSNTIVTRPVEPIKSGYTFLDWYMERDFHTRFTFFNKPTADITLYAKFAKNPDIPQNIKVGIAGFDKLQIDWDQVSDIDGYEIQRATSPNGDYNYIYGVGSTNQSYIISDVGTESTYYFKMRSYRIVDGQYIYSAFSPVISGKPVLEGVTSVKAAPVDYDQVIVNWAKSSEASGYEIYRATTSNGQFSKIGMVTNGATLSFTDRTLTTGKTYYYQVRAYRTVGEDRVVSSFSNTVSANPILASVRSVKAAPAGYNKIKIYWTKVSGANGYELYRATSKTGKYSKVKTITSGSTLSYINSSLTPGKTYYYKVKAYRTIGGSKGYSFLSNVVSAKPTLAKPSTIKAAKASSTSIKVSWSKVSEASGYELYRAASKTGTYTKIKTQTTGSSVSYTNKSLQKKKTYYYKVRAYRTVNGKKIYSSYTSVVLYKL